ncbi:unnamed protein product [Triticum aestivum]|uniref:Uncharacterized protein n=1 Tax=Triticum aestivum TaxID=4565 RepID=A0A7H4LNQ6_WHEAT|nr:unnamed protein product [Triticum aestivum]
MADRVHPAPLPPLSTPPALPTDNSAAAAETAPLRYSAATPGASYVVRVPKDQALRVPHPDRKLAARPARRRMLRRACCGACCALLLLLVLAATFVGAVYLVFRPRAPSFSVTPLSVAGLLEPSPAQLDAAVRANNGANRKVGVDYRGGGGEVSISYSGVLLVTGRWPAFYQAPRNVTQISMPLTRRDGVALTDDQRGWLAE